MNYLNECELQGVTNNIVYVIYTKEGPYDTLPTYEAAQEIAELDNLTDYKIYEEEINV